MNKKILLLLPLASLILSGCVMYNGKDPNASTDDSQSTDTTTDSTTSEDNSNSSSSSSGGGETPVTPDTPNVPTGDVTTYLVLGEYGLYQGKKGSDIESLFLENTITLTTEVGRDLPGKEDVTSTSNSTFKYWQAYEGGGAPVVYNSVPAEDGKILYAVFENGNGSSSVTPTPDDGLPKSGYGLYFTDKSYAVGTFHKEDRTDPNNVLTEYLISNYEFKANDGFTLYDFSNKAGWIATIDAWSFGSDPEKGIDNVSKYLTTVETKYYKVVQDFTTDVYIKIQNGNDQIYFGKPSSSSIDEGGGTSSDDTPTTGYGIYFTDKSYAVGTFHKEDRTDPNNVLTEYLISNYEFKANDQFSMYNFSTKVKWVPNINSYSFNDKSGSGTAWSTYLEKGNEYYTVKADFTADVYLQIQSGNDAFYFELKGSSSIDEGGSTTSDEETTTENKITVYFAGVGNWTDINEVKIGLTGSDLALCSKTTGDDTTKGQYKRSITSSIASSTLNMFFNSTTGKNWHPVNKGTSNDGECDKMSSSIYLYDVTTLEPGSEYIITWTGWKYNYTDWSHAWFTYTFAKLS